MMYVDIHNHFTWGVDDGLKNKDDMLIALKNAKKDNITEIVLTPHMNSKFCDDSLFEQMSNRMDEVIHIAKNLDIKVYKGNEVMLDEEFLDVFQQDKFFTMADSSYVLCEFPVWLNADEQREYEYRLEEVIERGFVPVIAHVERYFHNGIHIKRVKHWIKMGCVIQVNRSSFFGFHGKQVKKNADKLLKKRMIHIVASDAHGVKGNRIAKLSDAYAYISKKVNKVYANLLCIDNPRQLIHDDKVRRMKKFGRKEVM